MHKFNLILLTATLTAGLMLSACRLDRDTLRGGQLYVTSTPADATLICDGVNMGQTPATVMDVTAGEHLLILRKSGYREVRKTVVTQPSERQSVDLKLEPQTGLLLILSTPSGAEIDLDGVSAGKTPLYLHDTPFGQHRITASVPGHLPRVITLTVADQVPQKIEINLTSDSARILVETAPTGAVITLDGATIGKTPQNLPAIASGTHTIELALPGYSPFQKEFSVQAGDQRTIKTTLAPLPGKLTVLSTPPAARIYLNDQYKAETPHSADVPAGQYAIRAEARGFDPQTRTNRVVIGTESVVEFNLVKSSGTILISTEPPGIGVYMDGELRGTTRGQRSISEQLPIDFVPRGKRMLQFTRPGYFNITRTVDIQPKQTVILHEKLQLRPVPFVPSIIIRTGQNAEDTFRGIVRERFDNGNIKLEIEPGIFKTFTPPEIMSIESITNAVAP
ncbi:MAG: PEGA domain-containing protein [Verrucomicrobia bacterium]|nr:PEGA domain-containing protein [Verrucomicrobiota bacterium]MBU1734181.1 PEGA domain-containing protein [Verrucomicrobiota bacterium]MBU1856517.1 PEGA domain-containing protein [Verrucomicrobiota bacterium]